MVMVSYKRGVWVLAVLAACGLPAVAARPLPGISRPSGDVVLSFVRPGKIALEQVKEGDAVKAGQLLVKQDDQAELVTLAQLKTQAEDEIRVKAAAAQLEQKKVELKKLEEAGKVNAATALELERARVDVTIADLSLDLAKFEKTQAKLKYEEMLAQVGRMKIESPIDGRVEKISKDVGEGSDALVEVIRVVSVDPLWVELPVDLATADGLGCGQGAEVEFPLPGGESSSRKVVTGKVTFIAAVADPASSTRLVRVEVPNRLNRPAGEPVLVTFAAAGGRASPGASEKSSQ
jgi:RND family efflux transporter MFP subunit